MAGLAMRGGGAVARLLATWRAAAEHAPAGAIMQRMAALSTDAPSSGATDAAEAPPKKRRGRPPKAKPAAEAASEAAPSPISAAPKLASKSPPKSKTAAPQPSPSRGAAVARPPPAAPPSRPFTPRPKPHIEGIATINFPTPSLDPTTCHSGRTVADIVASSPSQIPFLAYFDVPSTLVPEGEASFYHDPALTADRVRQPHYGCRGATAEFEARRGTRALMHRPTYRALIDTIMDASNESRSFFVDGWSGSGKSVAIYALAAALRAAGWVVMYVPSARVATEGGRFYRSDVDGDDMWDAPEAARRATAALLRSHESQLDAMGLMDVARRGVDTASSPRETVLAALELKDALLTHRTGSVEGVGGTAVIIDDYNALYAQTEYKEPMHQHYARPLSPDELRFAAGLRVLERRQPGDGVAVVAPGRCGRYSPSIHLPFDPSVTTLRVPRYDASEVAATAAAAAADGVIPEMPSEYAVKRALALTNGNARELREWRASLLLEEEAMGLSLGYKVAADVKRAWELHVSSS